MNRALILVVEDLAEDVVQSEFEALGYHILTACSSEEAIAQATEGSPAAVVVDLLLEDIDGLEICRQLRQHPLTHHVPLIAVTAPDDAQMQAEAHAAGVEACLPRPLDWTEVYGQLQQFNDRASTNRFSTLSVIDSLSPKDTEALLDFLGHDLRSPSSDIISVLELLTSAQDKLDPEVAAQLVHNARLAAHRQQRLIDEMLALFSLESGAYPLNLQPVDLPKMLHELLVEFQRAIERKALRVYNQVPDALPPVAAEPELLWQVLASLVNNSLKFCIRDDTLIFEAQHKRDTLTLTLTDTGRPVTPEHAATIFDIAMQWRARQEGSRSSVAWGLPFCRAAVKAMSGSIQVHSAEDGARTTFTITLPVARHIT